MSQVYAHARHVLIPKFEQLTGYTRRAVQGKIAEGVWTEGREYRKAPDGKIVMDMEGYQRWVEKAQA